MAGAGYKLFNTGDVLTAAQVNTYLNEQTVMVFASSAARTSALSGVLAEGMMSYLQDTNSVEVYNGTSWVNVGNAGDITEVQAGVGISIASGTGPIPVITNSSTDLITTAGDLLYGTAADTVARLGIGTAGQVLKVNSGATAPEWGTVSGGGKVLQVVQDVTTTEESTTSASYVDTNLSQAITPSSASSKVLVIASLQAYVDTPGGGGRLSNYNIVRTSTQLATQETRMSQSASGAITCSIVMVYLDSPSTTSATTYKVQFKGGANYLSIASNTSTLTLIEIGA